MRKYETIFIINPDLSEEESKGLVEKVRDIIQSLQGEVLKIDEWGKKRLAYEVKKMSNGFFVLLHFVGTPQVLAEVERNLGLMDAVLKHQTVRLDEKSEKTAQMLSGEKVSEKEEPPEPETEKKPEKSGQEEDRPKEAAGESLPEATAETDEPETGREEGTDT